MVLGWPGAGERLVGARAGWGGDDPLEIYMVTTSRVAGPTAADGETAARRALSRTPRPRAILALSDLLARGAMDAARRLGLAVPRDLSIVGIDDLEGNEALGLTSVFVPYGPMGELAGVMLASLIEGGAPRCRRRCPRRSRCGGARVRPRRSARVPDRGHDVELVAVAASDRS